MLAINVSIPNLNIARPRAVSTVTTVVMSRDVREQIFRANFLPFPWLQSHYP